MNIFIIRDITKSTLSKQNYSAKISVNPRTKEEYISQDECQRITNNLLKGINVDIKGRKIKQSLSPFPVFEYQKVPIKSDTQIPKELKGYKGSELIEKIQEFNRSVVSQIDQYIKRRGKYTQNYDVRNEFFKDIMDTAMDLCIKVYSPCAKTEYEVRALRGLRDTMREDGDTEITDEQIAYVECNARKFGLEIPVTKYYYASREVFQETYDEWGWKTYKSHGYTNETEVVLSTRDNFFESHFGVSVKKDMKKAFRPDLIPEQWQVHDLGTSKGQYKQVYNQLKYIESLEPETRDFFIADGYCRCPHCGEITKKLNNHNVDIRCEFCDGILEELICVSNDHLLYGTDIDNAYSSLEDIAEYLNTQLDTEDDEYEDE